MDKQCEWVADEDGVWDTECGNRFEFVEAGPDENGFDFCPYCGGPLSARLDAEKEAP